MSWITLLQYFVLVLILLVGISIGAYFILSGNIETLERPFYDSLEKYDPNDKTASGRALVDMWDDWQQQVSILIQDNNNLIEFAKYWPDLIMTCFFQYLRWSAVAWKATKIGLNETRFLILTSRIMFKFWRWNLVIQTQCLFQSHVVIPANLRYWIFISIANISTLIEFITS